MIQLIKYNIGVENLKQLLLIDFEIYYVYKHEKLLHWCAVNHSVCIHIINQEKFCNDTAIYIT